MPQVNIPVHPARQDGLGATQGQVNQNQYYKPSAALNDYNAKLQQSEATAVNTRADNAMLGLGAVQQQQQEPVVSPQQVQAEQIADGIIRGQVNQNDIATMIQSGQVDPTVADAALGMAQQFLQADQARLQQSQGLGGF